MAPITIATMKQSRTFIAAVLAILALSTVGLFAGRDRASVAVPQPQEHRSLRSLSLSSVYYDPKTVTPRDPQILAVTVDDSQTPPQKTQTVVDDSQSLSSYPLRDTSNFPGDGKKGGIMTLKWLDQQFSDMSPCLDFKCNNDHSLCDNTLQTNYDNPDGTPPCCTHILRDMLRAFDKSMTTLGLDYFVGFGTLLGLIRSGRVIPWTIDNDIVLESERVLRAIGELWNAPGLSLVYPKTNAKRKFPRMCVTSHFAGGRLQKWEIPTPSAFFHDRNFPYIDFYFGEAMGQNMWGNEYRHCRHFISDAFPTKRFPVYQGQFALNFPANPEALLNRYYGLDWMTPKQDDSQHGEAFQICKVNYGLEEP